MPKFKTCDNGHNYDIEKHNSCPYCPQKNGDESEYRKTLSDFNKTLAYTNISDLDRTVINDESQESKTIAFENKPGQSFNQTQADGNNKTQLTQSQKRKLVGWLVVINDDSYGNDFRLYEGRNKIGTATGCDIVLADPSVSGEHTTIFFQNGEFLIQDLFSTNGTKVNDISIREGVLKEGDKLKLGNTLLKFKSVF